MTHVQVTVNKAAGVLVMRTIKAHGSSEQLSRSLFSGGNRKVLKLI